MWVVGKPVIAFLTRRDTIEDYIIMFTMKTALLPQATHGVVFAHAGENN